MGNTNSRTINIKINAEVKDVTEEILGGRKDVLTKNFAIVLLPNCNFGLYNFYEERVEFEFIQIEKLDLGDNFYIIKTTDGFYSLFHIYHDRQLYELSPEFKELIKVFKKFILVKDLVDNRKIIILSTFNTRQNYEFCLWSAYIETQFSKNLNHAIVELPNGNNVILKKDGLIYSDYEFNEYIEFADDEVSYRNEIYLMVKPVNFNTYSIIRISDLKVFEYIDEFIDEFAIDEEVFLILRLKNLPDKKYILLRISDFKSSNPYHDIGRIQDSNFVEACNYEQNGDGRYSLIRMPSLESTDEYKFIDTYNFAFKKFTMATTMDGKDACIRLSDFKEANFE